MPNWCNNTLEISCSEEHKKDLQELKERLAYADDIIIPKEEVEKQFKIEMNDITKWRGKLRKWVDYKKGTAIEYFKKEKHSIFDKEGNIVKEYKEFSFQGIIPRPKNLNINSGSRTDEAVAIINAEENGDYSKIDSMLNYGWTENTREALIEQLKERATVETMKEARTHLDNVKKYGSGDWYNWSINNWGTKWDACSPSLNDESETNLIYSFETAWSPPEPVIEKMAELYPNLYFEFSYAESGCDFAGEMEFENGECVRNESGSYIEYEGICNDCGEKLIQVEGEWYCDSCEKKVCICCFSPYEDGATNCEECGSEL